MDKNTFETYEYLPTNGNETEQFFLVQDDGTFLLNKQVQYVTQIENNKPLDNVMYDITPQQFLVDVQNTPDLITVPDQFILPQGENNIYNNSFLIQPQHNVHQEQMQQDVVDYKHSESLLSLDTVAQTNQQTNSCTEITLSDTQYQMLEKKGWILLEINGKTYLLDTLGLHDITTNDKMIQKLKTEIETDLNEDTNNRIIKAENEMQYLLNTPLTSSKEQPSLIINNGVISENHHHIEQNSLGENKDTILLNEQHFGNTKPNLKLKQEEAMMKTEALSNETDITRVLVIENDDIRREGSTLKVKTKLSLRNFPEKIVIGTTVNGKQLVARVVKPKNGEKKSTQTDYDRENGHTQFKVTNEKNWAVDKNLPAIHLGSLLTESEFLTLIQHLFQTNINKCSAEDVVAADSVIAQLLQLPAFKTTVMNSNLVVTKTVQNEDSSGKMLNKGLTAVLTGRVTSVRGEWHFVHLPYMLQKMMNDTEEFLAKLKKGENIDISKKAFDVLHVQISESKQSGTNIVKVSVTVNKRCIPMNLISSIQKMQPDMVYACSACASLFKTEELLIKHQETQCQAPTQTVDSQSTVDLKSTDCNENDFSTIEGKTKLFVCKFCDAKFTRLNTIKKHVKTHYLPPVNAKSQTDGSNSSSGVYKCSMCPSSYFHPSTLSKHIVARHIKIKT